MWILVSLKKIWISLFVGVSMNVCNWMLSREFVWEGVRDTRKLSYILNSGWTIQKSSEINLSKSQHGGRCSTLRSFACLHATASFGFAQFCIGAPVGLFAIMCLRLDYVRLRSSSCNWSLFLLSKFVQLHLRLFARAFQFTNLHYLAFARAFALVWDRLFKSDVSCQESASLRLC